MFRLAGNGSLPSFIYIYYQQPLCLGSIAKDSQSSRLITGQPESSGDGAKIVNRIACLRFVPAKAVDGRWPGGGNLVPFCPGRFIQPARLLGFFDGGISAMHIQNREYPLKFGTDGTGRAVLMPVKTRRKLPEKTKTPQLAQIIRVQKPVLFEQSIDHSY